MPSAMQDAGVEEQEEVEEEEEHRQRLAKRQRLGSQSKPTRNRNNSSHDTARTRRASRIFAPFRTLGLVCPTPVPFTAVPLGKTTFQITTSVGQCLQTYDLRRGLNLVFITRPQTPGPITSTVATTDRVLAAWTSTSHGSTGDQQSRGIWVFKRGKKIGELQMPLDLDEDVVELVAFGSWIVGCCATQIQVWSAATYEHHASLLPPFTGTEASAAVLTGGICNIHAFPNKILAGREDGTVEIWNVSTAKLIYTIQPPTSDCGPVTAIQATPALALFAFAYMNGHLVVQDVELDEQILKISAGRGDQSPITCISFRTDSLGAGDDGRDAGVMATASFNSGDVTLWDLNKGGKRMGVLRNAHSAPAETQGIHRAGGISKVDFLPGQAIIVTSGLDNSLKTWIFDETPFSPIPRILHSRSGHAAPITTLDFLPTDSDGADADGKWLLSASRDQSLWGWSLRRDAQSTELSQGHVQKKAKSSGTLARDHGGAPNTVDHFKAPNITCMACSLNRDGGIGTLPGVRTLWASAKSLKGKSTATEQNVTGWESVVTGHAGEKFARTWFWGRKRAGRWILETGDASEVTSVAISPCGTFALLGSASGGIDMYNLQSGLHRQRFPARLTKAQFKKSQLQTNDMVNSADGKHDKKWPKGHGRHSKRITGLHVDNLNRTVISSGLDGKIKFWDFMTGSLLFEIDWTGFVEPRQMVYHGQSDLIAVSCDDSRIRVVDTQTRRIVRDLGGCVGEINDLCFSNDGRWIIAASSDLVLRVWDLPTGHLIDAVRLQNPCTALAFSPTGEYLAVAQEATVGVDLWSNRTLFTHVPTQPISDDDIAEITGPTASGEGGQSIAIAATEADEGSTDPELDPMLASVEQLSKDVTTLSLVPKSRWQTLLHLDLIRARNKPKEPPKAPEKAPFFLPSLQQQQGLPNSQTLSLTAAADADASTGTQAASLDRSRIAKYDAAATASPFTRILISSATSGDYTPVTAHFKTLAPPAADVAIRSLDPTPPYTELSAFVDALTALLEARRDYELGQAWMAVFLRCHGEVVQEALQEKSASGDDTGLAAAVKRWRLAQTREKERLGALVGYCSGVVGFLRSAR